MSSFSQPSVVIVIPVYNAGMFLKEAIDSCLRQTYQALRIVVINDASTDNIAELLGSYDDAAALEVITNHENKGKGRSLNTLLPLLTESYIALMDADDVMYPERIEKQVAFMEKHPGLGASSGFMDYISSTGKIIGKARSDLLSEEDAQQYVKQNDPFAIFCPCAMLRAEIFKDPDLLFRPQFWPADDVDLWNRIHEKGWQVFLQPEPLMQYRIHGSSAVTSSFFKTRHQFEFLRECMRARRRGDTEPTREEFVKMMAERPLWTRFNSWRKTYAKGMYRSGGFAIAEKKPFTAVCLLVVAGLLQPLYVFNRLKPQVLNK
ncbi:MAG: glycosyltransferase family A protein [Rubritalea sp.]|uniref:glycosyltransferase family 2 protein n=1 Tax=Rubritalea sp. TaxID=2109375 RepID=UPI0032423C04